MTGKQPKRKPRPGVDVYGRTPLHHAASDGDAAQVKRLLAAGADANAQDDNGWSALHFAAQAVAADVTGLLLDAGADCALRDAYGNTPLSRAVFACEADGGVIERLRAAGADPLAENDSGVSPVSLARTIANYDVARFFTDLP